MRLFVGIEFTNDIMRELLRIQKLIRSQAKHGRFVAGDNLHLTLQFLGEVPPAKIGLIEERLHITSQQHNPFSLTLNSTGSFGKGNPLRVVWVGLNGDLSKLAYLQNSIAASLAAVGYPPEDKPYQPHVTLGREVELPEPGLLQGFNREIEKLPFTVERFSLIKSTVENGKRIYSPVQSFALSVEAV